MSPLFHLGQVVATPAALRLLTEYRTLPHELLRRHLALEQGTLDNEDHAANRQALADGSRILSSFQVGSDQCERVRVITEAVSESGHRDSTCILLPGTTDPGGSLTVNQEMQTITKGIASGVIEIEDARPLTEPLKARRESYREELAALPEPKPVPTVEEVNPARFRARIIELWRNKDITVRRKALDRILVEVKLAPGLALVRYSWKADPSGYTYQEPSGPP